MATRSLNKVLLIGNLTRDPELRYTPQGTAVCSFGLATNRQWTTDQGERKEEVEFHTIVTWNKLAEICSQYLAKGSQVYVDGRMQTRRWTAQDGTERKTTEVVANEVIFLARTRPPGEELAVPPSLGEEPQVAPAEVSQEVPEETVAEAPAETAPAQDKKKSAKGGSPPKADAPLEHALGGKKGKEKKEEKGENPGEDIPF